MKIKEGDNLEEVPLVVLEKRYDFKQLIVKLEESVIVPSSESIIPFLCNSSGEPLKMIVNAIGVTWILDKGSIIKIGTRTFKAGKETATIKFLQNGPVIQGLLEDKPTKNKTEDIKSKKNKGKKSI